MQFTSSAYYTYHRKLSVFKLKELFVHSLQELPNVNIVHFFRISRLNFMQYEFKKSRCNEK